MSTLHRFNKPLEEEMKDRLLHGPQHAFGIAESVLLEAETLTLSLQSSVNAQNQARKFDGVPAIKGSVRVPTICSAVKLIRNDQLEGALSPLTD